MTSRKLTIRDAQEKVRRFVNSKEPSWAQLDNRFYLMTHMVEELGELARHMINFELELSPNRTRPGYDVKEAALPEIRDALGDLLYNVLKLGVSYAFDIEDAFVKSMERIRTRYGQ
ncbi:MAG: MazG nucleotide pyrophosphohydrolase domain-containing protein [Candidatus Thorarchaeota archaeon]|jgi:NTP pyrophosphatase (non-canonical NTP hydrolase)